MDDTKIELVSHLLTIFQDGNMPTFLFLAITSMKENKNKKVKKRSE